jgi:hypothetical protein
VQPTIASLIIGLATAMPSSKRQANSDGTMGFIGCSMSENVAQGYVANGGKHMWRAPTTLAGW